MYDFLMMTIFPDHTANNHFLVFSKRP